MPTQPYSQWSRERACEGKVRYSGRQVAANAATALAWIGRTGLDAYRCPWCDHWHLGRSRHTP